MPLTDTPAKNHPMLKGCFIGGNLVRQVRKLNSILEWSEDATE